MKSKTKWFFAILATGIIIAVLYGFYIWNKPRRDVKGESGIKMSAAAIFDSFATNENRANVLYLNKAIEVSGEIAEVKNNQAGEIVVYLKSNDPVFGVNCTFRENPGELKKGSVITFKGVCTGYLSDVIINQGVIIKK
jgi:hypothetical protein